MRRSLLSGILFSVICSGLSAGTYPVSTPAAYNSAVKKLQPGDTLTLKNGVWKDFKMVFKGEGTAEKPIVLTAETPGLCTIEGESNLRISGNHLIIEGLVFVNGHTPSGCVIEFKTSSTDAARHTTLRNCVIDEFNNPEKSKTDNWVNLCGQYNTVEYCYFGGKKNGGTTFIVSPNGEGHTENFHHIYRNYFGIRPKLGANGGETMRIGTSHYSMENSNTLVEGNFFEHCNGEVEIISVKSCENRIIDNTFLECEGSLVLRHGNRNEVSGNYIIGNGKKYTGGIRVINEGHKIYNNYLSGLTGVDFRGPLVIMNGVPNSPINRYHQVKDVDIAFNTFVDCALPWQFCVGSDEERSLSPENIRVANNIVYSPGQEELIKVYDRTDGFTFENNVLQSAYGIEKGNGFLNSEIKIRRGANGMLLALVSETATGDFPYIATDIEGRERTAPKAIGAFQLTGKALSAKELATGKNCGPSFQWNKPTVRQRTPVIHQVAPGKDNLLKAIRNSAYGDILELTEGEYINTRKLWVEHPLTLRAKEGATSRPVIKMDEVTANTVVMFELVSGTTLHIDGIALSGNPASSKPTKYAFITGKENNLDHYNLFINNCEIYDFKEQAGAIFKGFKTSFTDTLQITNSVLRDSYRGIALNDEKEDKGFYNGEYIIFRNTLFKNFEQWVLDFYRGGNDESTLGGFLTIDHCVFDHVYNKSNQFMIRQTGLIHIDITNSVFCNAPDSKAPIKLSGPYHFVTNSCIYQAGKLSGSYRQNIQGVIYENPGFEKKNSYQLKIKSPLLGKATDGGNIGLTNNK